MINSVNTIYFQENTFIDTKFSISLDNNFDELFIPPVDTYPNQVRSDVKEYYNSIGNKPFVDRLEINHLESAGNNYFLFRAGIFESMFAGLGFEYLTVNRFKNISYGFELFQVKKRDYDQKFSFLDYQATTGHINFYHYFDALHLTTHISAGKYLAGDKGITYDFSRRFKNGFKLGFFFSRTDVSKEKFGEGSFDKGVYLSIPISSLLNEGNNSSIFWRPLTKDPAQKLNLNTRLFNILDRYIY